MNKIDATSFQSYLKEACQLDSITIMQDPVLDERQVRATKMGKLFARSYDFGVGTLSIIEDINSYFSTEEPETPDSCEHCKFFSSTDDFGVCRRFPPTTEIGAVGSVYPKVHIGDWCGEFQST